MWRVIPPPVQHPPILQWVGARLDELLKQGARIRKIAISISSNQEWYRWDHENPFRFERREYLQLLNDRLQARLPRGTITSYTLSVQYVNAAGQWYEVALNPEQFEQKES